jgi:integrase
MTRAAREQARQRFAEAGAGSTPTTSGEEEATEQRPEAISKALAHDGRTGARTAQRDHALISLALATGLRAIELSLLDVGDLVSERRRGHTEWWLSLPDEKTKGQRGGRTLPLAPELMATLLAYIRSTGRAWDNPEHRATPLFLALARGRAPADAVSASQALMHALEEPERRARRLRPEQIRGVIHRVEAQWLAQRRAATDEAAETAGDARHISPHALRHSAAIALLLGDEASERPPASVEHVRGWLGHFDIRTTQRYLAHIESRDQRRRFAIRPQTRKAAATSEASPAPTAADQPTLFEDEQPR